MDCLHGGKASPAESREQTAKSRGEWGGGATFICNLYFQLRMSYLYFFLRALSSSVRSPSDSVFNLSTSTWLNV